MNAATQNLMATLKKLEDLSLRLKQSLMKRDTESIMKVIHEQEQLTLKLNRTQIDLDGSGPEERKAVIDAVTKIRRLQKTSQKLACTFLAVVDKTVEKLNSRMQANTTTYGSHGAANAASSPLLVHQKG